MATTCSPHPNQENIKSHKSELVTMVATERLVVNGKECDLEKKQEQNFTALIVTALWRLLICQGRKENSVTDNDVFLHLSRQMHFFTVW